jgi:hypothetical protein
MNKLAIAVLAFSSLLATAQVVKDTCVTTPLGTNANPVQQISDALQTNLDQQPAGSPCFDPLTDPRIQKYFQPNHFGFKGDVKCEMFETEESMKRMHQKVLARCKEYGIDPRLVYLTTIGESHANPFIQQGQRSTCPQNLNALKVGPGRAFSMFQFYGGSNAALVLKEMKLAAAEKPPSRGLREVVFDYYFDHYLKRAKESFIETEVERMTCLKVKKLASACRMFSELSPIEQLAKLDLGNIGAANATKRKLVSGSYKVTKGYDLFYEASGGTAMVPDASGKKIISKTYAKIPVCGEK